MSAPSPIISAELLAAELDDPQLRIADVRWTLNQPDRGRDAYAEAHLPGAVFVDLDADLARPHTGSYPIGGRHPLPDPGAFAARMGELGFGSQHRIIVYDDTGGTIAGRLWWMLDSLGHTDVQLLDGGIDAWRQLALPVTTEVPRLPPAQMQLATKWSRTIDRSTLVDRLADTRLLDARAIERYRGEVEPVDRTPGHIPTARSAPATANLRQDGHFLAADELRARFAALGAADGNVVSYCGSGVTAAHTALAMRLAGLPDPLLYDGSYSDWSAAEMPIAIGDEPGHLPDEARRA